MRNAFQLDKFAPVTQNSSQIVFSYNVTFRIYSQNSISLHPAGRFQLQFVSLRSTTISPCTRVAGTPEAFLFRPFRRASPSQTWLDEGSPSARQRARSPRCAQPAMRHRNASDPASRGRRRTQRCLGRQVPRATRSRRVASAHGAFRTGLARVCVGKPKN